MSASYLAMSRSRREKMDPLNFCGGNPHERSFGSDFARAYVFACAFRWPDGLIVPDDDRWLEAQDFTDVSAEIVEEWNRNRRLSEIPIFLLGIPTVVHIGAERLTLVADSEARADEWRAMIAKKIKAAYV